MYKTITNTLSYINNEYDRNGFAGTWFLSHHVCILWSQSKQRNEVADAKPVVLTLKVKFFKTKIVILILS